MTDKARSNTQRTQKLRLPYMKRKKNAAAWTYDHRAGVFVTLILYLVLACAFVGSRIVVASSRTNNAFLVDLQTLEDLQREAERLQQQVEARQRMSSEYEQVLNRVSNENAERAEEESRQLRGDIAEQVAADQQAIAERMSANRRLAEERDREIAEMWESRGKTGDGQSDKNRDSKVAGTVTVSYSLVNPLRHSVYLDVPAYRCQRGGVVVVNITVSRNGNVTQASVDKAASTPDDCMQQTAVGAARRSRFDINTSAPERHTGTITYTFVAQ